MHDSTSSASTSESVCTAIEKELPVLSEGRPVKEKTTEVYVPASEQHKDHSETALQSDKDEHSLTFLRRVGKSLIHSFTQDSCESPLSNGGRIIETLCSDHFTSRKFASEDCKSRLEFANTSHYTDLANYTQSTLISSTTSLHSSERSTLSSTLSTSTPALPLMQRPSLVTVSMFPSSLPLSLRLISPFAISPLMDLSSNCNETTDCHDVNDSDELDCTLVG